MFSSCERRSDRRVVSFLITVVVVLTTASLMANLAWYRDWPFGIQAKRLFGVDEEFSLATWWSVVTLAGLAVLAWAGAVARGREDRLDRAAWLLLAGGFAFLSADEACMLHERIGGRVDLHGAWTHARWLVLWLPLSLLGTIVVFWLLWRSSPRLVVGLSLGAIVFLAGAAGTEAVNARLRHDASRQAALGDGPAEDRSGKRDLGYIAGTALEECLEMSAVVVWYAVMLRAVGRRIEAR